MSKYACSILVLAVVVYLSFFTPPKVPLGEVPFIDKWTHMVMYGGWTLVILWEQNDRRWPWIWQRIGWAGAGLVPAMTGGVIELLQAYCTGGRRSGEWMDWLADIAGTAIVLIIFELWQKNKR